MHPDPDSPGGLVRQLATPLVSPTPYPTQWEAILSVQDAWESLPIGGPTYRTVGGRTFVHSYLP